jgi:hypothetical protein
MKDDVLIARLTQMEAHIQALEVFVLQGFAHLLPAPDVLMAHLPEDLKVHHLNSEASEAHLEHAGHTMTRIVSALLQLRLQMDAMESERLKSCLKGRQ